MHPIPTNSIVLLCLLLLFAPRPATAGDVPDAPDAKELTKVLQKRLDKHLDKGLLEVVSLSRRGVYPHQVAEDSRERLMIYYDAELHFLRDHRLSDWDALSVRSLVWQLGSTPSGIRGVDAAGNRAGDTLQVTGTVLYARPSAKKKWKAVAPDIVVPDEPPEDEGGARSTYRNLQLQRLAALSDQIDDGGSATDAHHLTCALDRAIAEIESRQAKQRGLTRLATGSHTGEYHALGEGIAEQLNVEQPQLHTLPSAGSADNCTMVHRGDAEVGLSQNDIAYMAHHGQGLFQDQLPMERLRALCALYPEAIQLVVLDGSKIKAVEDLAGKAVDVGPEDSGTRINAAQLLAASGMTLEDLGGVQGKHPGAALDDLVRGRVDAVLITGVYPFPEIAAHAAKAPMRLVPLTEAQVEQMWQDAPFMLPLTIPTHTYPGQSKPVRTVGVTALLVAREDLPDADVERIMEALLDRGDALSRHTLGAYFISRETADRGVSIPIHPAARAYIQNKPE